VTGAAKTSRPRPTVADVAREAGVSPSTVSRALHTQGYASDDVRRRVRAAAAELGYVVNSAARSLRSRTSTAVGVLISDLRNPFYADLATGIEQVLRAEGRHIVLINDSGEPDEEMQAAETLVAMRVPGVILTPATELRSRGCGQDDRRTTRHGPDDRVVLRQQRARTGCVVGAPATPGEDPAPAQPGVVRRRAVDVAGSSGDDDR
jgi:hypothetical protein